MKLFRKRAFVLIFMITVFIGYSQEKQVWSKVDRSTITKDILKTTSSLKNFKTYSLDIFSLKEQLLSIVKSKTKNSNAKVIEFPTEDGRLQKFSIKETPLLHPDLAAKFPSIKTYEGVSIKDNSINIFFTINKLGLYAMILSPDKNTVFIDPYTKDRKTYVLYTKSDVFSTEPFECLTESKVSQKLIKAAKNANELKLRTFRLAIATTEEYSNYQVNAAGVGAGSTRQDSITAVMSAITVTMSRVNPIYQRDVAIKMQLVANNDQLIFLETDSDDDPYTNNDGSAMLSQNQTTIDNIIGSANYDIGHVFSTGGGGVAYLASVCTASKAGGVTGSSNPVGDPFDIDYVAHEMGHQYGANHTFNGTAGNCNGTRNNATAVEPGSGSTIMAYAGICSPQNVQARSDAYFHTVSIQEMYTNISDGNGQCAAQSNFIFNQHVPIADAGSDYTIPKSTPFKLNGSGFDGDGDELTYCWEQVDNEVTGISIPPSSTQTGGAVFRSIPPSKSTYRYMPTLPTVVSGNISSTWEVVPSVSRTMDFALTVRDNVIGEGQTDTDSTTVTVNDIAGPFVVTSQNTDGIVWTEGTDETITWDVAGTDSNGINVSNVNILLSLDGGLTFPVVLASNTANDGQEIITVPSTVSGTVRIMIEAIGNIFYAINSNTFSIGVFETTCNIYNSTVPASIPDNNLSGVTSTLNVLDDFLITDVNVSVDITHTWIWDLQIYLESPDGTEVLIYDRSCGSSDERHQNIDATFDDAVASAVCDNSIPAIYGPTKPDNFLSAFNGLSSFGIWKLKVVDNAAADTGVLNNWSIELCETNQTATVDEFELADFTVYPNPFNTIFNISFRSNNPDDMLIIIYDVSGRIVEQKKYTNLTSIITKQLNLEKLSSGIYILHVKKGNASASKKIIKY